MAKNITIKLNLDGKPFEATIQNSDELVKKLNKSVNSVSDGAAKWGMIVTGFNQGLQLAQRVAGFIGDAIDKYAEQEQSIKKVEQAIKATGGTAGFTATELQKIAGNLQDITAFDDDVILNNATAQILTFTNITGTNFKRVQQAALDVATTITSSPEEAATRLKDVSIQLGKALNNPISGMNGLSRAGIQFSDSQKAVIKNLVETNRLGEAQTLMLDELNRQYGGQAASVVETATGQLKQLEVQIDDQVQRMGKIAAEVVLPIAGSIMKSLVPAVDWLSKALTKTDLQKATEDAHNQRLEFEKLAIQYDSLRGKTEKTKEEQDKYNGVIETLQKMYPQILGNIDLQKAGLDKVKQAFIDVRKEMEANIRVELRKAEVTDLIKEQEELIKKKNALEEINVTRQAELELIKQGKDEDKKVSQTGTGDLVLYKSDKLKQQIQNNRDEIHELFSDIQNYQKKIDATMVGIPDVPGKTGGTPTGTPRGGGGGKNEEDELKRRLDIQGSFNKEMKGYLDEGEKDLQDSIDAEGSLYTEREVMLADYFEQQAQRNQEELDAAQIKNEIYQALNDELVSIEQQKNDIIQAMRDADTVAEVNKLQKDFDNLDKKKKLIKDEQELREKQLKETIENYAMQYDANKSFLAQLGNAVRQEIKTLGAGAVAKEIADVIKYVPWPLNLILAPIAGLAASALFDAIIPQFATGVENFSGGLAIVGEKGPELVNLPRGSNVYPNEVSVEAFERAYQNRQVAVQYHGGGFDPSGIERRLDELNKRFDEGIIAKSYLDNEEAKKVYNKGNSMRKKSGL